MADDVAKNALFAEQEVDLVRLAAGSHMENFTATEGVLHHSNERLRLICVRKAKLDSKEHRFAAQYHSPIFGVAKDQDQAMG